jgi:hypothetical protein
VVTAPSSFCAKRDHVQRLFPAWLAPPSSPAARQGLGSIGFKRCFSTFPVGQPEVHKASGRTANMSQCGALWSSSFLFRTSCTLCAACCWPEFLVLVKARSGLVLILFLGGASIDSIFPLTDCPCIFASTPDVSRATPEAGEASALDPPSWSVDWLRRLSNISCAGRGTLLILALSFHSVHDARSPQSVTREEGRVSVEA